jgi:hypothetical protein
VKGVHFGGCSTGVSVSLSTSDDNVIGPDNVFFDNATGVFVTTNANGNTIKGSKFGTDATGATAHPGGGNATAISISGSNNIIGGASPPDRNIVSANTGTGITLGGTANIVRGNYVGTDAGGTTDLGNGFVGISVQSGSSHIIGGTLAGEGNLVSGNANANIAVSGGANSTLMTIAGNIVGPDINGTGALSNGAQGIAFFSGSNNTIGPGNVVSDNSFGVALSGSATFSNTIKGNMIGTDLTGTTGVPNSADGVNLQSSTHDNLVGGSVPADDNIVAFNTGDGVEVNGAAAVANSIRSNSIHDNSALEISLAGGNNGLAAPSIAWATAGGVSGDTCANCMVDVFSDDSSDAQFFEGSTTADGTGKYTLLTSLAGPNVTATNTNGAGNTSALSAAKVGLDPDTDGDGVANAFDNCPNAANQSQTDGDGDGDGDPCDNCPSTPNSNQDDSDGDGVGDLCDNCYSTDNGPAEALILGVGNQTDSDGDGVLGTDPPPGSSWGGDACDVDDDNDGVPDTLDVCRTLAEDYDGWEDGDTCPDTDNDGDGICDPGQTSVSCSGSDVGRYVWQNPLGATVDCRNVGEDFDAFHDSDGCPEPDNDYDNFPDSTDDCPATDTTAGPDGVADTGDEPVLYLTPVQTREDFDGVLDNDGCHDSPGDDYDLDGYSDEDEALKIGTNPGYSCGGNGWPSNTWDASPSTNKLDIQDIISFVAPVRRLDTSATGPSSARYNARWDLAPGPNSPFTNWINIIDLTTTLNGASPSPAYPPMFGGQRAFGKTCPLPPQ